VDLSRDAVALLDGADLGAAAGEPGPLDGDAEQVPDGVQELQVFGRQAAPAGAREVHHAELLFPGVERDAGVVSQPVRAVHEPGEAAASEHVDVRRPVEIALFVGVEAVTVARAVHAARVVREGGGQVPGGGKVRLEGGFVYKPDPTGLQPQKLRDPREREPERLPQIDRAVELPSDGVQHRKLVVAALKILRFVDAAELGHGFSNLPPKVYQRAARCSRGSTTRSRTASALPDPEAAEDARKTGVPERPNR
jgi:hypothetical protein